MFLIVVWLGGMEKRGSFEGVDWVVGGWVRWMEVYLG